MSKTLTDAAVEKMRGGPTRREIADAKGGGKGSGLYLVIQTSGAKSWALRFRRPDGRPAKLTLGPVDFSGREIDGAPVIGQPLTLAAARQLATTLHRDRERGIDIAAEREAQKRRRQVEKTEVDQRVFPLLARRFIETYTTKRGGKPRRWRETARLLGFNYPKDKKEPLVLKNGLADRRWAKRDVGAIDENDVWAIVKEARDFGVPGRPRRNKGSSEPRARAIFAALSVFFRWLRRERLITTNPCSGLERPSPPAAGRRVLTMDELRWFWLACETADKPRISGQTKPFAAVLRLLALTGCRLNEIAGMSRSELSGGNVRDWTIPGARTKNHRDFVVPLPSLAREIIEHAPSPKGNKADLLFTTTGRTPVSGFSRAKKRVAAAMLEIARAETENGELTIKPFRLHDLRRTVSTELHALGVAPHTVESCLNHISGFKGGVAGTYNLFEFYDEKLAAMERWARWLGLVIDRDLYRAHKQRLARGDDEMNKKAKEAFLEAISDGGERWKRYISSLTRGGDNIINLRSARRRKS